MFSITLVLWFALLPAEMAPNGKIDTLTVASIEHNRVVKLGELGPNIIIDTITLKDDKDELIVRREFCHLSGIKVKQLENEFWIFIYGKPDEIILIVRSKILKETITADLTPAPPPPPQKDKVAVKEE